MGLFPLNAAGKPLEIGINFPIQIKNQRLKDLLKVTQVDLELEGRPQALHGR